tara:strand:+ start:6441 stop:6620 length:180 start_codon:yes stop_codon:yes gene_type:complete
MDYGVGYLLIYVTWYVVQVFVGAWLDPEFHEAPVITKPALGPSNSEAFVNAAIWMNLEE